MFNAGTGIELASWRRNAVSLGMGYRYQKIVYEQIRQWEGRAPMKLLPALTGLRCNSVLYSGNKKYE